jgi:hypothetical protein
MPDRQVVVSRAWSTTRVPVIVWVVQWLLVQIPATLAYHVGTSRAASLAYSTTWNGDPSPWNPIELSGLAHWLVEPLRLWDGSWYRLVAIFGYDDPTKSANAAFFPLYPLLMRWGSDLTPMSPETVGYVVSNVAFLGALIVVKLLVTMDFGEAIAHSVRWAMALFPTAFFFRAVYTESLFLLLATGTLLAARHQQWMIAGMLGLLAALTRSADIMLLAPLAVLFLRQCGWHPRRWFPQAFPAALPALGPVIFGWILVRSGRQFFDWIDQQWQWDRFSATPWRTFACTLNGCTADVRLWGSTREKEVEPIDWGWIGAIVTDPGWTRFTSFAWRDRAANSDVLEFVVTVGAFALVIAGLRRVPLYYTVYVVPPLLVPLFSPSPVHPLMSMPRFVLPLFPLYVVLALLMTRRRIRFALAVTSCIGVVLLTMQFANWYWVA